MHTVPHCRCWGWPSIAIGVFTISEKQSISSETSPYHHSNHVLKLKYVMWLLVLDNRVVLTCSRPLNYDLFSILLYFFLCRLYKKFFSFYWWFVICVWTIVWASVSWSATSSTVCTGVCHREKPSVKFKISCMHTPLLTQIHTYYTVHIYT